jgi:hypothetical protein
VSQTDGAGALVPVRQGDVARRAAGSAHAREFEPGPLVNWLWQRRVLLVGLALIALQVAWRARLLGQLFFAEDDFFLLDRATKSTLSWGYLSATYGGHLMIGPKAIIWFLAHYSSYDWGWAEGIVLAMVIAADLAALRTLRTLMGDRPAVLIPLTVYLLCPLTLEAMGFWSAALNALPLQIATFMAVDAHVRYVRARRVRWLAASVIWIAFGLLFFEKTAVLPLLLFALTSAFFADGKYWISGVRRALARYWPAWTTYVLLIGGFSVMYLNALHTTAAGPAVPGSTLPPGPISLSRAASFGWLQTRLALAPGLLGGPWRWYPMSDGSGALVAPPHIMSWLAIAVVVAVAIASVLRRVIAWRAWAIFAAWVVAADIAPVSIGRLGSLWWAGFGLQSRYVADSLPVLAMCLALAAWPVSDGQAVADSRPFWLRQGLVGWQARVAAAIFGAFVFGSAWSSLTYQNAVTANRIGASYIATARRAVALAPHGTKVLDWPTSGALISGLFGKYATDSVVIGDMERGKLANKLHWMSHAEGTVDGLRIFGPDGRLYLLAVKGAALIRASGAQGCWPVRHGQIAGNFLPTPSIYSYVLHLGYLWLPLVPGQVTVSYGDTVRTLTVTHGLHSVYLPVSGSARGVVISGPGAPHLCLGDAEVGILIPNSDAEILPAHVVRS